MSAAYGEALAALRSDPVALADLLDRSHAGHEQTGADVDEFFADTVGDDWRCGEKWWGHKPNLDAVRVPVVGAASCHIRPTLILATT